MHFDRFGVVSGGERAREMDAHKLSNKEGETSFDLIELVARRTDDQSSLVIGTCWEWVLIR